VDQAIREFKNQNPTTETHINVGITGKSLIPSSPVSTTKAYSPMSYAYYTQSPGQVYAQELEEGLLTYEDATQLCQDKYERARDKEPAKLLVTTPLTAEQLRQARERFPKPAKELMSSSSLLPLVHGVPDDDGRATPSHQNDTQEINTKLWGTGESCKDPGQWALPVPPCLVAVTAATEEHNGAMSGVVGGTVPEGGDLLTTVTQTMTSTAPSHPEVSQSPSEVEEDMEQQLLYLDEHPFIRTTHDSDNPNETPYSVMTTGFPLYKKSYMHFSTRNKEEPLIGFKHNRGIDYIHYPITQPYSWAAQAHYVQTIMGPNPIVVALRNNMDKVSSKLLYASPIFQYNSKPIYKAKELELLDERAEEADKVNRMIEQVGDVSLAAEVHCYQAVTAEIDRISDILKDHKKIWGNLATAKVGSIRQLKMADALAWIKDQDDGLIDDTLRMMREFPDYTKCHGCRS